MESSGALSYIQKAEALKTQGNEKFRTKEYQEALKHYAKVPLYLNGLIAKEHEMASYSNNVITIEEATIKNEILHTTYVNMAACHLALQQYPKTIDKCQKALGLKENYKAYYRRAVGYLHTGDLDRAKSDLDKANEMCPDDPAVRREYGTYLQLLKKESEKQRKIFSGMFDKLSKEPQEESKEVRIEEFEEN